MSENPAKDSGDLGILKRLAVLVLFVNPVLFWFLGAVLWEQAGEADNIRRLLELTKWLWLGSFPVLLAGYLIKRRAVSRLLCAAGLAMFALTLCCMGYALWFVNNGEWQPWQEVSRAEYVDLELDGEPRIVVLTEAEAARARETVAGLWAKNPCVLGWDGAVDIPKGMPRQEGALTASLLFSRPDGGWDRFYVGYPYYCNAYLAADLEACREVEAFINGLSEKYNNRDRDINM